jgi:hypothetical protein
MSNEMGKQINKVKNFGQFLKEGVNNNILHINKDMLFDYNNLTPISGVKVEPYPYPDMDEDLKYISTYIKGKSKNINDIRILMIGVKTGKKYFMFLKEDFGGSFLHFIDLSHFKEVGEGHYKFKSYNYYLFREDINDVNVLLNKWLENNPKPFQYSSYKVDNIDNYTYIFDYNGNKY